MKALVSQKKYSFLPPFGPNFDIVPRHPILFVISKITIYNIFKFEFDVYVNIGSTHGTAPNFKGVQYAEDTVVLEET